MAGTDLVLERCRKGVTYGLHVLLGALEEHRTATSYRVRFAHTAPAAADEIRAALPRAGRVLVLWSFYSPDADSLSTST